MKYLEKKGCLRQAYKKINIQTEAVNTSQVVFSFNSNLGLLQTHTKHFFKSEGDGESPPDLDKVCRHLVVGLGLGLGSVKLGASPQSTSFHITQLDNVYQERDKFSVLSRYKRKHTHTHTYTITNPENERSSKTEFKKVHFQL